jgi:ligand-binding sensor domain-containing protein
MMSPPLSPTDSISLPLNGVSPISHYNEQTDSFEYVVDKNTALSTRIGRIYEIAGDENGSIWFSTNEGLYEYIQNQSLVKMHIQTTKKDALQLVTATETGTIWAIRGGKNTLFRYTPTHNAVIEYPVPSIFLSDQTHNGLDQLNKIYIDSKNNLWLDDLGWVELDSLKSLDAVDIENQVWYQVIRSPVFITDQGGAFHYTWQRPTLAFDDADGFIWFNSPAGVVRLDKQNGNWCKTATSGFVIMGGSSNNPWLILGTELYTYSAKQ